jgi:leucyl aminopeptidase
MKCAGALTRKARNRRRQGVLTGEDCVSSEEEDDVVVGKMKEKREEEEGEITVVAGDAGNNVTRAAVAACGEESVTKQWPALLQSKCEVLEMEKELAMQRWTQQCVEIAKTAPTTAEEMSHCVMQATKRRGTVSAPCTPRTTTTTNKKQEEQDSVQLVHRIEQLQKSRQQRELENQANAVQGRVQLLQQRSKTRYGGVRIVQRNKENLGRELDPSTLISVRSASSLVLP